jgi:hypothetical protein
MACSLNLIITEVCVLFTYWSTGADVLTATPKVCVGVDNPFDRTTANSCSQGFANGLVQ